MRGLPQDLLEIAKKTDFFVLHERGGVTFHPVICSSLSRVFSTGIERIIPGQNYDPLLYVYHSGKTIVLLPKAKFESTGEKALAMLKLNPVLVASFRKKFLIQSRKFIAYMRDMVKRLPYATDADLFDYYQKYVSLYFDTCLLGEPIALALDKPLGDYLRGLLAERLSSKEDAQGILNLLMSPAELSFIAREEHDLSRIAECIREHGLSGIFTQNETRILGSLEAHPVVRKLILSHVSRYFLVPHDYLGNPWTLTDFLERLKAMLREKAPSPDRMQGIKREQAATFALLCAKGLLSPTEKKLFLAARDTAMLLDLKKEKLSQIHFYANQLVREVAMRHHVDFQRVTFLLEEEFKSLIQGDFDSSHLVDRSNGSTYFCINYHIYRLGRKETDYIVKHCIAHSEKKHITGLVASPGIVRGRVRILSSPKECAKFLRGEVLVAGMTTPEYVPAIRKASAIITDEGGITCHAAIISRELGIPCIVGTGHATKLLRTGDLVEMDAGKGVVLKLDRKSNSS